MIFLHKIKILSNMSHSQSTDMVAPGVANATLLTLKLVILVYKWETLN